MSQLSVEQLAYMLTFLSPDVCRDDWWRILAAGKSEMGEQAYNPLRRWSEGSDKFSQQDFDSTWRSLSGSGIGIGIGIGTLIYMAKKGGWRPDRRMKPSPRPKRSTPPSPPAKSKTIGYALRLRETMNRDDQHVAAHPYANKKGIDWACGAGRATASGRLIGRNADCIIVPMRTLEGGFTGVEVINTEGVKQTFGNKGTLVLGNTLDLSLEIYIVEGWADAASTWRLLGNVLVIAAFGKSNMEKVYDQFQNRFCTLVEDA